MFFHIFFCVHSSCSEWWIFRLYMWCFARFGTICSLKNVENIPGEVLVLAKLLTEASNLTKSNNPTDQTKPYKMEYNICYIKCKNWSETSYVFELIKYFFTSNIKTMNYCFLCIITVSLLLTLRTLHKKWNFPLRISSVNVTNPQFRADLVSFIGEILNGKPNSCKVGESEIY